MIENCELLPFHVNILQRNIEKIHDYIINGYDVNSKDALGRTGLYYAIFSGSLNIVKILIQAGGDYKFTDVQFDGVNLLHIASAEDHLDIVKYFVEELKFDVNDVDNKGNSSLFYAMLFESVEIAEYLICRGAKNRCACTPVLLVIFCRKGAQNLFWEFPVSPGPPRLKAIPFDELFFKN